MKSRRLVLIGLIPALLLACWTAVTVNYLARVRAKQAFVEAVKRNDTNAVLTAMAHGADPNAVMDIEQQTFWQAFFMRKVCYGCPPDKTALEQAAQNNNLPIVQALLHAGAVVNNGAHCGDCELDFAEQHKNAAMVALLKKAGSQKNQVDVCL